MFPYRKSSKEDGAPHLKSHLAKIFLPSIQSAISGERQNTIFSIRDAKVLLWARMVGSLRMRNFPARKISRKIFLAIWNSLQKLKRILPKKEHLWLSFLFHR